MISHTRELTVSWADCDAFGQVYFPSMMTWFNDTEHELLVELGFATRSLISRDRSAFVMGEVSFRFCSPVSYGETVSTRIELAKMTRSTLHWQCVARHVPSGRVITEGVGVRVFARVGDDGKVASVAMPAEMREAFSQVEREPT